MLRYLVLFAFLFTIIGCQSIQTKPSLYEQLGAKEGVENIAESFVRLMVRDPRTEAHFRESNLERFFEKLVEQFCEISGGPCTYTGDEMLAVHKGMNITEGEFNATVEILQQAMRDNHIPLAAQNRLLALLAPMRGDMIYK